MFAETATYPTSKIGPKWPNAPIFLHPRYLLNSRRLFLIVGSLALPGCWPWGSCKKVKWFFGAKGMKFAFKALISGCK